MLGTILNGEHDVSSNRLDYEQTYDDFWKKIVEHPDGTLNLDQVKRELSDYRFMMQEVPKVYSHVTGGTLSKPNYYASSVITVADEYIDQQIKNGIEDAIEDELEDRVGALP